MSKIHQKKEEETNWLVWEIWNPNTGLKIHEWSKGEDIWRIMKVIFGENGFYRQVSSKAWRNLSTGWQHLML